MIFQRKTRDTSNQYRTGTISLTLIDLLLGYGCGEGVSLHTWNCPGCGDDGNPSDQLTNQLASYLPNQLTKVKHSFWRHMFVLGIWCVGRYISRPIGTQSVMWQWRAESLQWSPIWSLKFGCAKQLSLNTNLLLDAHLQYRCQMDARNNRPIVIPLPFSTRYYSVFNMAAANFIFSGPFFVIKFWLDRPRTPLEFATLRNGAQNPMTFNQQASVLATTTLRLQQ